MTAREIADLYKEITGLKSARIAGIGDGAEVEDNLNKIRAKYDALDKVLGSLRVRLAKKLEANARDLAELDRRFQDLKDRLDAA